MQTKQQTINNANDFEQFLINSYADHPKNLNLSADYQLPIGFQGCRLVLKYINWGIQRINLSMYRMGDEGLQQIIQFNQWKQLGQINLNKNQLTSAGILGVQKCPWKKLTKISLDDNKIDRIGAQSLVKADWIRLKYLGLSGNRIGQQGAKLFGTLSNWPELTFLNLHGNLIGNNGFKILTKATWKQLRNINLSHNKLDANAMFYLKSAGWQNLQKITLNLNPIGLDGVKYSDIGCVYLTQMPSKKIKQFAIYGSKISLNGIKLIIGSSILVQNCFMELIRNQFSYSEITATLEQHKMFCNPFGQQ